MALWSNTDANTSAPKFAVAGGLGVSGNGDALYGNTTADVFVTGITLGDFGVDSSEAQARNGITHAGWVLRTTGSGGRAGRVFEETLVAMGSMTSDGSDDTPYPDATIFITTQPSNLSLAAGNVATFTVVAGSNPDSATLAYQWHGPTGIRTGATTATLTISNAQSANNGGYYVIISSTGASSVTSANATLTVT